MDFGLLNLNKPSGLSSHAALRPLQRAFRPAKVGHAGTLDPLASGVLVVLIGPATRLADHIHTWSKEYRATFLLGRSSETEDIEGTIVEEDRPRQPTRAELEMAAQALTGTISQRPPAFSALKIDGQRAYHRARRGETLELAPRAITIEELEIEDYNYPVLTSRIVCSTGTYVRSLGRDLAQAVGTQAVMSALVRTRIGTLHLSNAVSWAQLENAEPRQFLQPAVEAVRDLTTVVLPPLALKRILRGQTIERARGDERCGSEVDAPSYVAGLTESGQLAAILQPLADGTWRATKNFLPQTMWESRD